MATHKIQASPAPLPGAGLGRIAFEAYVAGLPQRSTTKWEHLEYDTAAAWCAAAQAVITATIERTPDHARP